MEQNKVQETYSRIDFSLVITLIATAVILGGIVWGMKKSGVKILKDVAANVA